jgi:ribonucleoside-diphosphate reductase beta chain
MRAIAREKTWSKYLLSRGTILGLSEKYICDYLDWLGLRVLKLYGLTNKRIGPNPLPWMDKYYNSEKVRNAGQERGFTNYMLGAINQDVDISKLNSKYGLLL